MKKYILTSLLAVLSFAVSAQIQLSDSAKLSLMTTSPWPGAVYAVYGHTAMLVQDDSTGIDAVFNYGYFDTTQPNFLYHYMRGKTDYVLGVVPLDSFLKEYREKGVEVVEQELNLSQAEKQVFWEALYINSLPENRRYRYNNFYDNCVTRPRDLIEKYTVGKVVYPKDHKIQTFRDLIHECVSPYPWMKFGIDLIIGNDADRPISLREKMFIPSYLMNALDESTVIVNDSVSYPVIKSKSIVVKEVISKKGHREWGIQSPLFIAFVLLLITILISVVQYVKLDKTKLPKIYDTVLFALFGIGGLIIFFLMFFSEQPATSPNWNFAWMNIFALLFAGLFWVKSLKKVVYFYHFINFAVLILFLLSWWFIPQQIPMASIPLSMSLCIRSGMNVYMSSKKHMKKKRYVSSKYMKAGWGQ